jgi:hypothetical protein
VCSTWNIGPRESTGQMRAVRCSTWNIADLSSESLDLVDGTGEDDLPSRPGIGRRTPCKEQR